MFQSQLALGLILLCYFTLPVYAGGLDDRKITLSPYIGIAAGSAELSNSSAVDASDAQDRIFAGAYFNKNFGVEVGYSNLGDYQSSTSITAWQYSSYYAALVAKYAINKKIDINGKFGIAKFKVDYSSNPTDREGTEATFGIGATYNVNKKFAISIDYTRTDFNPIDVDSYSIGLIYNFKK